MDVLQELTLGRRWVAHNNNVNVPTQFDAIGGGFMHTAQKQEEDPLFDFSVSKRTGADGIDELNDIFMRGLVCAPIDIALVGLPVHKVLGCLSFYGFLPAAPL